jgi:hypothetical protein
MNRIMKLGFLKKAWLFATAHAILVSTVVAQAPAPETAPPALPPPAKIKQEAEIELV